MTDTVDLTSTDMIGVRRRRLERQLADLRRARGRALADGKDFDNGRIAAVEQEIAALDDVETEVGERQRVVDKAGRRARYLETVASFKDAHARRLTAVAKAEKAARELATALNEVQMAARRGFDIGCDISHQATSRNDGNSRSPIGEPNDLTPLAVSTRLGDYLAAVLRGGLGAPMLGKLDLHRLPGGAEPTDAWAALEERHGNAVAVYERQAPSAE